jgi:trimethylamine--corrinoid protein Co-methyltransferase
MQPKLELLSNDLIERVLDEAYQLLVKPGVKVQFSDARKLLGDAGAQINNDSEVVSIPGHIIDTALKTVPHSFILYDRYGNARVHYQDDAVHFDPGSSGVHILDPDTFEHRPSETGDLVRLIKVAEMLQQYDAQSTAVVCNEVPKQIGDFYRLYLVLLYSAKPIVTGAFAVSTLQTMIDMLSIFAGSSKALAEKPQAIFDVCPSPPLIWSEFGAQNLVDLARAGIPAQIISMPLAGAASPVTLLGSIVQHAAECLSGIAIHQLANPGAPIVWGGAPAIFDMRKGTTPMGAIETAMIDIGYTQTGKYLGLPTHTYLGASDAKIIDAQSGMESGISAVLGALAGINMISGAGMLDFLACHSPEKLVVDAEAISMAQRLVRGIEQQTETLATALFEGINFKGDFLKQKITRQLFAKEQLLPSYIIDRDTHRGWQDSGSLDMFARAKKRVTEILSGYRLPELEPTKVQELQELVKHLARDAGMESLPELIEYQ